MGWVVLFGWFLCFGLVCFFFFPQKYASNCQKGFQALPLSMYTCIGMNRHGNGTNTRIFMLIHKSKQWHTHIFLHATYQQHQQLYLGNDDSTNIPLALIEICTVPTTAKLVHSNRVHYIYFFRNLFIFLTFSSCNVVI